MSDDIFEWTNIFDLDHPCRNTCSGWQQGYEKGRSNASIAYIQLQAQCEAMADAADMLLSNFALDWYVSNMGKSESATSGSSGIAAKIHNRDMGERIRVAINELHAATKTYRASQKEEG